MESEKITLERRTPHRSYDDACGAAHALDLVGERWALLVMRELMLGPKRFTDLKADLAGISANVLTQRLEGLETSGIVLRRKLPPPASGHVYELTPWGYESEPIFQSLGRWAARSPLHDPTLPFSAVSLFLSFRTMLDPERARGLEARIGFRIGAETFLARLGNGVIEIERLDFGRSLEGADVIFSGTAQMIAASIYGRQPLDGLCAAGAVALEGDRGLAERFVTLFPLPAKVEGGG